MRSSAGRLQTTRLDAQVNFGQSQVANLAPVEFAYDAQGRLTAISQTSGAETRSVGLSYDTSGRLATLIDPFARAATFEYNGAGRTGWRAGPCPAGG